MKKIFNAACIVSVATILFACQKQNDLVDQTAGTAPTQTTSKLVQPSPEKIPYTVSEWLSVGLDADRDGGLSGKVALDNPLPGTNDTDFKLAYVRRNVEGIDLSTGGFSYHQLAVEFDTPHGNPILMNFELGSSFFEIFVDPIGITSLTLNPSEFKDCNYRYLVIPQEIYTSLHVDWSNYNSVARILNFTP